MTKPRIESGVPVAQYPSKYPFAGMKVGESFVTAEPTKARTAMAMYQKRHPGRVFTTRKLETGGVRIWRVK